MNNMRLRKFHRMVKQGNQIVSLGTLEAGTATITELASTTATLTNAIVADKLVIPTTAFTGSAPAEAGIYVTGTYLIVGDPTAVWKSVALG